MRKSCPYCNSENKNSSEDRKISSFGRFYRKSDGQFIARFWCKSCKRTFSSAYKSANYRQKKRHKNETIRRLLAGGMSQREIARTLHLNRKTVIRKFLFLAEQKLQQFHKNNLMKPQATEVEFDDLETFEHTKCKPLSVTLMVEHGSRRILDFEVSEMPAKGKLAKLSVKKYGKRADQRRFAREKMFQRVEHLLEKTALIRSDSNPHYPQDVKKYFPRAYHETILGARGAITGQGELKKLKWDPLFSLNHTCAMLRANINRLFRKTWCTTKKKERLRAHIAIYAHSHNMRLSTA